MLYDPLSQFENKVIISLGNKSIKLRLTFGTCLMRLPLEWRDRRTPYEEANKVSWYTYIFHTG